MPAVNKVCATLQDDQDLVSEHSLVMYENEILGELQCDVEEPCIVQLGLLWYVAPRSLNDDLLE